MSSAFDSYWSAVDADLAGVPMAADLQPLPMRSSEKFTVFAVRLTSIGPYRIFGYYSVPTAAPPQPALLLTPRYGSVNHVPDYRDRERYVVLQLMHRGQRLADQPFAAEYPGLLTQGIASPDTYIYRSIVADCLRGAEFLLSQSEVDGERVAIQGDDLALLTAARRPRFRALQLADLLFYRLLDGAASSDAYPAEELNDFLRAHPSARSAVAETLTYFDPLQHAALVKATALLATPDSSWTQSLTAALGNRGEEYLLTHQGAVDHDWLDAWMAQQLGVQPASRFREAQTV